MSKIFTPEEIAKLNSKVFIPSVVLQHYEELWKERNKYVEWYLLVSAAMHIYLGIDEKKHDTEGYINELAKRLEKLLALSGACFNLKEENWQINSIIASKGETS